MTTEELKAKVLKCIAKKQEGDYWDFKRQWYEIDNEKDKGRISLLHDVICMANLIKDEDGLIIIGVDEEKDSAICDVKNDPNRKNTHEMVKFLRDKPFDGGIRPTAYVESIDIENKTIDVIVVENSSYTPFYLTKDCFHAVKAYHIYTRVGDSNTPIDRSADSDKIEALWKKRFGIGKPVLERFRIYIEDNKHWISVDGAQSWYYEFAPEFRIETEYDDSRDGYEYYCLCQVSIHGPGWYWLRLKYHDTLMYSTLLVSLDGGNFMTAIPSQTEFFGSVPFSYYTKEDINYGLYLFFKKRFDEKMQGCYGYKVWNSIVPIMQSKSEAKDFFRWVRKQDIVGHRPFSGYLPDKYKNTGMGDRLVEQYIQAQALSEMLYKYRSEMNKEEKKGEEQ